MVPNKKELFFSAAKAGDYKTMETLLRQNISCNYDLQSDGFFARSISHDNLKNIHLLLTRNLPLPKEKDLIKSLLITAIRGGSHEIVNIILQYNIDKESLSQPLLLAVSLKVSDATIVKLLLNNGADIHAKGYRDATPLHEAAYIGNYETTKILLERGACINAVCDLGETPLMKAAQMGNLAIVQLLLEHDADREQRNFYGNTAFLNAIRYSQIKEVVSLLLPDNINQENNEQETGLIIAARNFCSDNSKLYPNNIEIVKLLLEQGAFVNKQNREGISPLMAATISGNYNCVKLLLEHGADVHQENCSRESALFFAAEYGYTAVVETLLIYGAEINKIADNGETPLSRAINGDNWGSHEDIIQLLIEQGADVNSADGYAMQAACASGTLFIVRLLLSKGATIKNNYNNDDTPILIAAQKDKWDIVNHLLTEALDYNINQKDHKNQTILKHAVYHGNYEMTQHLLSKGASVNVFDQDNWSLLFHAIKFDGKDGKILELLINCGLDINHADTKGVTPLMHATKYKNYTCATILLNHSANINQQDHEGLTALIIAVREKYYDIAQLLLKHGADSTITDNSGKTALDYAREII